MADISLVFLRVDLDFESQLDCDVEISITNQVRKI